MTLDARVVIHGGGVAKEQLPKLAIRPYPAQYVWHWTSRSGIEVTLRPIRPEDEPLLVKFHATLSDRTVYLQWKNRGAKLKWTWRRRSLADPSGSCRRRSKYLQKESRGDR